MKRLKRLRAEKELSQARLAARAGLDPSTVNQIERGAREASPATLRKLADALEVSLYELMEEEAPKVQAPLFSQDQAEEPRRPEVAPELPEVEEWVRGLGPEAELIAMSDDEFYDHADSVIGGDPFKAKALLDRLERGRDAIENALKGSAEDMPEALHPNEPASGPEDRVYATVRRHQPRRRAGQWARARAHVRARNLFAYVLERTAAMPSEAQVEQLIEETAEKQA